MQTEHLLYWQMWHWAVSQETIFWFWILQYTGLNAVKMKDLELHAVFSFKTNTSNCIACFRKLLRREGTITPKFCGDFTGIYCTFFRVRSSLSHSNSWEKLHGKVIQFVYSTWKRHFSPSTTFSFSLNCLQAQPSTHKR